MFASGPAGGVEAIEKTTKEGFLENRQTDSEFALRIGRRADARKKRRARHRQIRDFGRGQTRPHGLVHLRLGKNEKRLANDTRSFVNKKFSTRFHFNY